MIDWILDRLEPIITAIIVVGVVLIAIVIWRQVKAEQRARDQACAHLWRLSQTHDDTLKITMRCELGDESSTTVVPVPIFLPSGR